ncbi:MAG: hypothetical protein HQL48_03545 [Gammaproteobacteria bacterium]|nr:hypothetical protein [Gammaproteobacteria bacterium]
MSEIDLAPCYQLSDRRIADALLEARRGIAPERVEGGEAYQRLETLPFVFR